MPDYNITSETICEKADGRNLVGRDGFQTDYNQKCIYYHQSIRKMQSSNNV